MELTLKLILQVGILFLMMVPGIILKKCKLVGADFGKGISNLILYIAQPVLVFYAYLSFEGTSFSPFSRTCSFASWRSPYLRKHPRRGQKCFA